MSIDDVDLAELAQTLREKAPPGEPKGYLRGKATLRELVISILGCSQVEAEDLVETLESRGYVRFEGNPAERSQAFAQWQIDPSAEL